MMCQCHCLQRQPFFPRFFCLLDSAKAFLSSTAWLCINLLFSGRGQVTADYPGRGFRGVRIRLDRSAAIFSACFLSLVSLPNTLPRAAVAEYAGTLLCADGSAVRA